MFITLNVYLCRPTNFLNDNIDINSMGGRLVSRSLCINLNPTLGKNAFIFQFLLVLCSSHLD